MASYRMPMSGAAVALLTMTCGSPAHREPAVRQVQTALRTPAARRAAASKLPRPAKATNRPRRITVLPARKVAPARPAPPVIPFDLSQLHQTRHEVLVGVVEDVPRPESDGCYAHTRLTIRVLLHLIGEHNEDTVTASARKPVARPKVGCKYPAAIHTYTKAMHAADGRVGQPRLYVLATRESLPSGLSQKLTNFWPLILASYDIDEVPSVAARLQKVVSREIRELPVADSATRRCIDGKRVVKCRSRRGARGYGQDGHYRGRLPRFRVRGKVAVDIATGVMWQRRASAKPLKMKPAGIYCKRLKLAGHKDWRLPTVYELLTVIDYGRSAPVFNPKVFPQPKRGLLWSSTTWAGEPWVIVLSDGGLHWTHYDDPSAYGSYYARCVRGHSGPTKSSTVRPVGLAAHTDRVVDVASGLVWQRTLSPKPLSWFNALAYCERSIAAGKSDWRLPSIKELMALAHNGCPGELPVTWKADSPWTLPAGLKGMWSSTPVPGSAGAAYRTNTVCGPHFWGEDIADKYHVLCVRTLPPRLPPKAKFSCKTNTRKFTHRHRSEAWCMKDGQREGPFVSRYPGKNIFSAGQYRNGQKDGKWTYYDDSGRRFLEIHFANGVYQGRMSGFHANGLVSWRTTCSGGLATKSLRSYHRTGSLRSIVQLNRGQLHGTQQAFDVRGKPKERAEYRQGNLHGKQISYEEGHKLEINTWKNGVLHGPHVRFHEGGKQVSDEGTYRNGRIHGPWKKYNEKGRLIWKGTYVAGKLHGRTEGVHSDGKKWERGQFNHGTGTVRKFHPNGKLSAIERYQKGRRHGNWLGFWPNGKKRAQFLYIHGMLHGPVRGWHANGRPESVVPYVKGRWHGRWVRWHKNGVKREACTYRDGIRTGLYRRWDEQGRIAEEGRFDGKGRRHGIWREYEKGVKRRKIKWRNGTILSVK